MAKVQKAKSKAKTVHSEVTATKVKSEATSVRRVTLSKSNFSGALVLGRLLAELVGTFVLTYVVLASINGKFGPLTFYVDKAVLEANGQTAPLFVGTALMAALTLGLLTLVLGRLSGAHLNPAVTLGLWSVKRIKAMPAVFYIIAQLLGAMLAVVVVSKFVDASVVAQLDAAGGWKQFFAETLGALIFGFGVASVVLGRKEGLEAAVTVGGSLLLGLVIAALGSNGLINPAVALGVGSIKVEAMSVVAYVLGPILGAIGGMYFYKLLQNDVAKADD